MVRCVSYGATVHAGEGGGGLWHAKCFKPPQLPCQPKIHSPGFDLTLFDLRLDREKSIPLMPEIDSCLYCKQN